ncbi:MAG: flagellar protein FlaG [Negativicutes bacterium]|nr:flagellar protein FlaG [Negativicutes bacterium]
MDVTGVKVPDIALPGSGTSRQSGAAPADGSAKTQATDPSIKATATDTGDAKAAAEISPENLGDVTEALNKFLQSLNTGIQFKVYDKTKQLIVQVVDQKTGQVLKEFPPHQLLDTLAAIREYVGVLLDKKV